MAGRIPGTEGLPEHPSLDADAIAKWLCDIGYGVDFTNREHPLPEALRRPLAVAWHAYDGDDRTTVEDYELMLKDEGCW